MHAGSCPCRTLFCPNEVHPGIYKGNPPPNTPVDHSTRYNSAPLVNDESPQRQNYRSHQRSLRAVESMLVTIFFFFFPFYIASYHNPHFERCTETCTFPFPQVQTVDRPHRLIHRQLTFSQSIHANLQKIANRPTSNSSNLDRHNRANYRQKSPSCWESIRTRLKMENHLPL